MRSLLATLAVLVVSGCGGGSTGAEATAVGADPGCNGFCADASSFLTMTEVETVIAQAVAEADTRVRPATIAVVDRVGNVLGVFRMNGAPTTVTVTSGGAISGGLEGVSIVPSTLAAIAKAVTAAFLSSEGNAFSTRTASQIVQEHFNPGERNAPSGPLFGVQFSQLPCGDLVERFTPLSPAGPGPKRSPLGLAADPGGLPLFKEGTPVGGIGISADEFYDLDKVIIDVDRDAEELIATAASFGRAAPVARRADTITVLGKTLRFADAEVADLLSAPASAPAFDAIVGTQGTLLGVPGYYDGGVSDLSPAGDASRQAIAGTAFGQPPSGIRAASGSFTDAAGNDLDAFVLVDATNTNRFPARAGLDTPAGDAANALDVTEVQEILEQALSVANRARAQIRQPLGSSARVSISVVDSDGNVLGIVRSRDAPVFGIDVSLQKARTAAFFSGTARAGGAAPADALRGVPDPVYLDGGLTPLASPTPSISAYVSDLQTFLGLPRALESDGKPAAFSDRAGGNLSRPFFPDGPEDAVPGPLSKPQGEWSIFSVGLQLDLIYNALIHHVGFVQGLITDVGLNCTGDSGLGGGFTTVNPIAGLANGIQIFPGSVPIYRADVLIGGIGVSGDGVDQDDLIAFLGLHNAGQALGGAINNGAPAIRADQIDIPNETARLRYVNCPQAPFNDSDDFDVCQGL